MLLNSEPNPHRRSSVIELRWDWERRGNSIDHLERRDLIQRSRHTWTLQGAMYAGIMLIHGSKSMFGDSG